MELEDQWWKGQLAADIYQALRYKELKLPSYKGQSPQLNLRRYFADLIAVISNHLQLCPAARHLAVYLLDLFMDRYDVTMQQLHMVSLSCLLLASKFEEREDRVPKLETLNSLCCMNSMNLVLTKQGLLHMELLLLETFQWNLYLPTAAHYIEYFLSAAVHEGDLHDGWPMTSLEKTKVYMAKYADYFLEVSLQDHVFLCFPPSLVAAACAAASRLTLHLSPTWPPRLQRLTGYTWENLVPCAEKLLIAHDSDVKEDHKQKCQQPVPQQQDQSMFHSSGQSASVAQYLHLSGVQYAQQTLQPGLPSTHRPGSYLSHSTTSLQPLPGPQHPTSQASAASLDPKANRSHQVSMQYSSAAPCFDR
ncbi:Cyclin-J [Oryzias melastigma]|uniref:Cyclin-J n=1 Tax=Oryzias melastigma TaxID=30732 RepID=A0A3B3DTM3_ORYME|nr:cyclin-J [Oryzias melastigma]KAF6727087.1 Cyclin-J [Oryzias melastigma]